MFLDFGLYNRVRGDGFRVSIQRPGRVRQRKRRTRRDALGTEVRGYRPSIPYFIVTRATWSNEFETCTARCSNDV